MKKILSIFVINFLLSTGFLIISLPVYAADCTDVAPEGDLTITTSCTFSGTVNGVDSGTGDINTAILTMAATGTLTIGATQQIGMGGLSVQDGGTVVIFDGASMSFGNHIWMTDKDADGYPESTTQIISSSTPPNARRRNVMTTIATADINDSFSCPDNSDPTGVCKQCRQGDIANQADGQDLFNECVQTFDFCNGTGSCSLHAKRVFISSQTHNGNLGGITGADNTCQTLADSAGLGGSWKAWVSDTATSVNSRMNQSSLPYVLTDEQTKIADNWSSLVDGNLDNPVLLSETGQNLGGNLRVWTNTTSAGASYSTASINTCSNWTTAVAGRNARYGINSSNTSGAWTDSASRGCNNSEYLYCFEQ